MKYKSIQEARDICEKIMKTETVDKFNQPLTKQLYLIEEGDVESVENLFSYDDNIIGQMDYIRAFLPFCGCGNADDVAFYLMKYMRILDTGAGDTPKGYWEERTKSLKEYKNNDNYLLMFLDYWLDNEELTEHGTCIPGWLTYNGRKLLNDLESINPQKLEEAYEKEREEERKNRKPFNFSDIRPTSMVWREDDGSTGRGKSMTWEIFKKGDENA